MRNAGDHLSFDHALRERVRHRGGDPLLTYYAPASGIRIEMSPRTFVNWVDKTANLVADELDLAEGDTASLPLAAHHPGHWTTLAWIAALWQVGVCVNDPGTDSGARPDLVVCGPEDAEDGFVAARATGARSVVACSLHPFGLGFSASLPDGVVDYGAEVPSQPDVYVAAPATPGAPLWQRSEEALDWGGVSADTAALLDASGSYGRRLLRPAQPYSTLLAGLVAPVLGDGSVVLVDGAATPQQVAEIGAAERIDD